MTCRTVQVHDESFEAEMIADICLGDMKLFRALIQPYERLVFRTAMRMLRNEADAEDVAQETFLKAFRNLQKFRFEAKFSTWLVGIALNEARARLRCGKKVRMLTDSFDFESKTSTSFAVAFLVDGKDSPSKQLELKRRRELLQQAITALSPIYREVVVLRNIEERSITEIATTLGINETTVKTRLHRARSLLRRAWPRIERASLGIV